MIDLKGKTAIITGGAQGIGRAIADKLASSGADIVIGDVNLEAAQASADEIAKTGVKTLALSLDVSNFEQVEKFTAEVVEKMGKIDILVNNAGITRDTLMLKMTPEDWDIVLKINLTGSFYCSKVVTRYMMKARSGAIVNVASIIGLMGNVGQANYGASKAGLIALTKTTAKEFASRGIRANAIAPGFIRTAMTDKIPEKIRDEMMKMIPLKQYGEPEDVANAVLFLASPMSGYITGQVVVVDGGMVMA